MAVAVYAVVVVVGSRRSVSRGGHLFGSDFSCFLDSRTSLDHSKTF